MTPIIGGEGKETKSRLTPINYFFLSIEYERQENSSNYVLLLSTRMTVVYLIANYPFHYFTRTSISVIYLVS